MIRESLGNGARPVRRHGFGLSLAGQQARSQENSSGTARRNTTDKHLKAPHMTKGNRVIRGETDQGRQNTRLAPRHLPIQITSRRPTVATASGRRTG